MTPITPVSNEMNYYYDQFDLLQRKLAILVVKECISYGYRKITFTIPKEKMLQIAFYVKGKIGTKYEIELDFQTQEIEKLFFSDPSIGKGSFTLEELVLRALRLEADFITLRYPNGPIYNQEKKQKEDSTEKEIFIKHQNDCIANSRGLAAKNILRFDDISNTVGFWIHEYFDFMMSITTNSDDPIENIL